MNRRALFSALVATAVTGTATWASSIGTKDGMRPVELWVRSLQGNGWDTTEAAVRRAGYPGLIHKDVDMMPLELTIGVVSYRTGMFIIAGGTPEERIERMQWLRDNQHGKVA